MKKLYKLAIAFAALSTFDARASCLEYFPAVVTMSGKLERQTFPGRPNFEDIEKGDEPETGFYLLLPEPVCTIGDSKIDATKSGVAYPQTNVLTVQLLLDQSGYEKFRPLLGKAIIITGTLMAAHTGHHHALLLLSDAALK